MKRLKGLLMLPVLCLMVMLYSSPVKAEEAVYTTTEDGVTVTLQTDKSEYKAGEEIHYTITVENNRYSWDINSFTLTYKNTEGLKAAKEDSMPDTMPAIPYGESASISGIMVGDPELFPSTGLSGGVIAGIIVGIVVLLAVLVVFISFLRKKKGGTKAAAVVLALILTGQALQVEAAPVNTVDMGPYLRITYAGQEVIVRATMDIPMKQQLQVIAPEDRLTYQRITCHDPSIFRDFDGTYYILGTHMTGGYTKDLYNWTSIDNEYRASFTEEVKAQIRAWNKDETTGNWFDYLWAPDIIYNPVMGKYCMYLSANGDDWKSNIVLLTADAVEGPYSYVGSVVYGGFTQDDIGETDAPQVLGTDEIPERYVTNGIANRKWGDKWPNCIDPCVFYDDGGKLWMSYGSWSGGIFMLELDEETGLRDYSVTYETNDHSDAYFGKKIAGGAYVSGEASYIQKVGDYYYLFISYGGLSAKEGYNIRIFRSENPDGDYVDLMGNSALYDSYVMNFNQSVGVRLFGGYKWRVFNNGLVAQGHNSAFVDEDSRAYIVFHTRTDNGSEGHYVKVHQLFVNKEGWLVAAPYQTTGEALKAGGWSVSEVAGDYEVILHEMDIDYKNLETKRPELITLNEDGTVTGAYEGTWRLEDGTSYIVLSINGQDYSGVTLSMNVEFSTIETQVFTAVGLKDQVTIWGSKVFE